jgi:hypothetical protein
MTHAGDDDLVLLHYGEPVDQAVQAHVRDCPECAARRQALAGTLAAALPPEVPVRDEDYAARVWERLEPQLAQPARVLRPRAWARRAAGLSAMAAALLMAFWLGRQTKPEPQPIAAATRERILLVAVGEHLERSQMVLVELTNAEGQGTVDVSAERAWADELVSANRVYRQTAAHAGETALAGVLEELERVLLEVAAGPDRLSSSDLAELRRRIESRGILLKVRVIGSQVREREKEALPAAATVS